MVVKIYDDKRSLSCAAAELAARSVRKALLRTTKAGGVARIIAATGASQFEFLEGLTAAPKIEWAHVEMFHLDEYIGLPATHPASFRKYLLERLVQRAGITKYHFLEGDQNVAETIRKIGAELTSAPTDVAFVGIGENGHLAFNDPPANFETEEPYLVVELDAGASKWGKGGSSLSRRCPSGPLPCRCGRS